MRPAIGVPSDVTDRAQVKELVEVVTAHFGRIDVLVNNAGVIQVGPAELMTLEDYGFAKRGQVGDFVKGGNIEIGGQLPVNTSGGLLSETGMPGMQLIHEGVRQMRGGRNQVGDEYRRAPA